VDHFTSSLTQDGKAGEQTACPFPLEPAAREGSYRLVAVEPAGGAQAVLHISVLAEKPARELLDRVEKVRLPKGSRLVFLGDSLTALFPGRNYPSILDRALRWRLGAEVEVINAGVSGNTILAMANRLEADVLQKNPTHVFVFEGANSCKRPYSPDTGQLGGWALPEDKYEAAWRDVLARLKEKKVKVVIMTMAPGDREILDAIEGVARKFGEKKNFWCDPATVAQVVAIQKRLAAEFGAEVIDVNALLSQRMAERARTGSPHYLHVDDGVHIGDFGAEAVAEAVLDYLGAAAK
jgi:lysophospholipase L1-like esterase